MLRAVMLEMVVVVRWICDLAVIGGERKATSESVGEISVQELQVFHAFPVRAQSQVTKVL
jgi:hypothetical protein